ncbi:hypothetical protein [Idiomarina abyssalis]|uniref:hypothetical protein n=1 Tax=Idiomarina abyssalis TaxID=86102 RepID=UPI003A90AEE8
MAKLKEINFLSEKQDGLIKNFYGKFLKVLGSMFGINPNKTLQGHFIFWLPIIIFVGWGGALLWPFLFGEWPTPDDYNEIFKGIQLPVFIISISIPLTVVVARFHATAQRKKSNDIAVSNQAFTHYYDHKKFFNEYLNTQVRNNDDGIPLIEVSDYSLFYKIVYPNQSREETDFSNDLDKAFSGVTSAIQLAYREVEEALSVHCKEWEAFITKDAAQYSNLRNDAFYKKNGLSMVRSFLNSLGLKPTPEFCHELTKIGRKSMNIFELCVLEFSKTLQIAFKFDKKNINSIYYEVAKAAEKKHTRTPMQTKKLGILLFDTLKDYKLERF